MGKYTTEQIRRVVLESIVYCSAFDQESIRIDYTEEDHFVGVGEETGMEYTVGFDEIDLDTDTFYQLVPVDIKTVL